MPANGQHFERLYDELIRQHFAENRQMLFLMGPRQERDCFEETRPTIVPARTLLSQLP